MKNNMVSGLVPVFTGIVLIVAILAILIVVSKVMYKKAAPNVAMIVTGPGGCKTVIGKGCIIGAGAVVNRTLPSFCTAVGVPARPVKFHIQEGM